MEFSFLAKSLKKDYFNLDKSKDFITNKVFLLTLFLIMFAHFCLLAQISEPSDQLITSGTSEKIEYYKQYGYMILPNPMKDIAIPEGFYVAIDDFIIHKNQTVILSPNVIIMFEVGKKIIINGFLKINGTVSQPIHLRSVPVSQSYEPMEFPDTLWGGVDIGLEGNLSFTHTIIIDAWKGITGYTNEDSVTLNCVEFKNVGHPHLKIGSQPVMMFPNPCSEYNRNTNFYFNNTSVIQPPIKPVTDLPERNFSPKKVWLGVSCGFLAASTLASFIASKKYYRRALKENSNIGKAEKYESISNITLNSSVICGSLAVASAFGFSLTFIIPSKE